MEQDSNPDLLSSELYSCMFFLFFAQLQKDGGNERRERGRKNRRREERNGAEWKGKERTGKIS